eukprot:SAG11_NODE_1096_length_5884_cov_4.310631_3_plen_227_part_00
MCSCKEIWGDLLAALRECTASARRCVHCSEWLNGCVCPRIMGPSVRFSGDDATIASSWRLRRDADLESGNSHKARCRPPQSEWAHTNHNSLLQIHTGKKLGSHTPQQQTNARATSKHHDVHNQCYCATGGLISPIFTISPSPTVSSPITFRITWRRVMGARQRRRPAQRKQTVGLVFGKLCARPLTVRLRDLTARPGARRARLGRRRGVNRPPSSRDPRRKARYRA